MTYTVRRNIRRAACIVIASVLLSVMSPTIASAHYIVEQGVVYDDDKVCIEARAEISHGSGGGYARGDTRSKTSFFMVNCLYAQNRPAGNLAVFVYLFSWSFPSNKWIVCDASDWIYNGRTSAAVRWNRTYPGSRGGPCGDTYYITATISGIHNDGWKTGYLLTEPHFLGASSRNGEAGGPGPATPHGQAPAEQASALAPAWVTERFHSDPGIGTLMTRASHTVGLTVQSFSATFDGRMRDKGTTETREITYENGELVETISVN